MKTTLSLLLLLGVLASGCNTLNTGTRRTDTTRQTTNTDYLKADVARLRAEVDGIAGGQERLEQEVDGLRTAQERDSRELRDRLAGLEQAIRSLDTARAKDREDIIQKLTGQISQIVRSSSSSSSSGRRVEEGYEHVVQPGETLSEIAAAYNTKVDTIVRANNMKSANVIRVGQKLFIPE